MRWRTRFPISLVGALAGRPLGLAFVLLNVIVVPCVRTWPHGRVTLAGKLNRTWRDPMGWKWPCGPEEATRRMKARRWLLAKRRAEQAERRGRIFQVDFYGAALCAGA